VIASLAFIVWLVFFDVNSLINQAHLSQELSKIRKERAFYIEEINRDKETTRKLMSDLDNLESFAREQYWMKRDNEDVYLIISETEEQHNKRLNIKKE
jgi:cell division protein FtsB